MKIMSNLFLVLFAATVVTGCSKGGNSTLSNFHGLWTLSETTDGSFGIISISDSGSANMEYSESSGYSKISNISYGTVLSDGKFIYSEKYTKIMAEYGIDVKKEREITFKRTSPDHLIFEGSVNDQKVTIDYKRITASDVEKMKAEFFKKRIPVDDMLKKLSGTKWELVSKTEIFITDVKESSTTTQAKDIPEFEEKTTEDGKKFKLVALKTVNFTDEKNVAVNGSISTELWFDAGTFKIVTPRQDKRLIYPGRSRFQFENDQLEMHEEIIPGEYRKVWIYKRVN